MGYRFCWGASGAGKSRILKQRALEFTNGRMDRRAFYIVPEQYTMQTQKDLVEASPDHGIMNIDVLSFGRLSHRIFEELGEPGRIVLNDVGKSLILHRVGLSLKGQLHVLGDQLDRPGMVSEIKSVISEFMQYGIDPDEVSDLINYADAHGQGALRARLEDLQVLYRGFRQFEEDRYETAEETMDLLADAVPRSALVKGSLFIFDGFTGFTPIQYSVLSAVLQNAEDVIISLTASEDGGPGLHEVEDGVLYEEDSLFALSRRTVKDISRIAEQAGVPHGEDIVLPESDVPRFRESPALKHLERYLFRYPVRQYREESNPGAGWASAGGAEGVFAGMTGEAKISSSRAGRKAPAGTRNAELTDSTAARMPGIRIFEATTPSEEARSICIMIRKLSAERGYAYRDFGIVTGDLDTYGDIFAQMAEEYGIPIYIDRTRAVLQNPLTETVRAALETVQSGFSYESVFRLLRSGLSDFTEDQVDRLENLCLAHGILSKKKWMTPFSWTDRMGNTQTDEELEKVRQQLISHMAPLMTGGRRSAAERTASLYAYLVGIHAQEKMEQYAQRFAQEGDQVRQKEYEQIYRAVIDLLDQIYDLLGDAEISAKDYLDLLETGFGEIRLGTLPQRVDRVLVGDMERTRLSEVKVLFFPGANDGNIPKNASSGGLLSDLDREFLEGSGIALSPSPREEMYIQRFYLYLNMTKQTDSLLISYAASAEDGSSLRPSYIIGHIQRMYPALQVEHPELAPILGRLVAEKDSCQYLARALRAYADGEYDQDREKREVFLSIYGTCASRSGMREQLLHLTEAAFRSYPSAVYIRKETARALYGDMIRGSVTRLEHAAQCYLQQFLQYGIGLKERDEYIFQPKDSGDIMHGAVSSFSRRLQEHGMSWREFTKKQGEEMLDEVFQSITRGYGSGILEDTARASAMRDRMRRILLRTIDTLQFQVKSGDFEPMWFEKSFGGSGGLTFQLAQGRTLSLIGRIDRVDLCREGDTFYVKIIDYKSGVLDLDPKKMEAGLQLQLLLYMNVILEEIRRQRPGMAAAAAALLYYRFADPILSGDTPPLQQEDEERNAELAGKIRKELRPKGIVNADTGVIRHLDSGLTSGASLVVPVQAKKTKDGSLALSGRGSHVFTDEEFQEMTACMYRTITQIADEILDGNITADPVHLEADRTTCTFCPYQAVCGFDPKIYGYTYRDL